MAYMVALIEAWIWSKGERVLFTFENLDHKFKVTFKNKGRAPLMLIFSNYINIKH